VEPGIGLEISCYGTVCPNTTHTYEVINGNCSSYTWSVVNGTIIGGNNASTVRVQWGNPPEGYGTLSIRGNNCSNICSDSISIKIPIISNPTIISGPNTVCLGETQNYTVPLWGSTKYDWTVMRLNGDTVIHYRDDTPNSILIPFTLLEQYIISVEYKNRFLGCSGHITKDIVVLQELEINTPNSTVCANEQVTFTTNLTPAMSTQTEWQIYNATNNLIQSPITAGSLNYTFTQGGTYRITASNVNACNTATVFITVNDPPPPYAGTISGPDTVCPNGTYTYTATPPQNSQYMLLWKLACDSTFYAGDTVDITFGATICDVLVYQQDITTGCISDSVIYNVNALTLAPLNISSPQVCAGNTISLTAPWQANVMYNWTINPTAAASVKGDNLSNSVTILANNFSNTATVTLTRTFCGYTVQDPIQLNIIIVQPPVVNFPNEICVNDTAIFSVNGPGTCSWTFVGGTPSPVTGCPQNVTYTTSGQHNFVLRYSENNCPPIEVRGSIFVNPLPITNIAYIQSQNVIAVTQQVNVSYRWYFNGNLTNDTVNSIPSMITGIYCCVVTDNITGCSDSVCLSYTGGGSGKDTCNSIDKEMTVTQIGCNKYLITAAPSNFSPNGYNWSIDPFAGTINTSPPPSLTATATLSQPGIFYVTATSTTGTTCYYGRKEIGSSIPRIDYSLSCSDSIYVFDNTTYCQTCSIPPRNIKINCANTNVSQILNSSQNTARFGLLNNITQQTQCTITMSFANCTVIRSFTLFPLPAPQMNTTGNCVNTPVLFQASDTHNATTRYVWNFGDSSSVEGDSVYHTYPLPGTNTVTLTAYNANGCSTTISDTVSIQQSDININGLLQQQQSIACRGDPSTLTFTPPAPINSNYYWSTNPSVATNNNTNTIYTSGVYSVTVRSAIGCVKEASVNASFYNKPTVRIIGKTCYCIGDMLDLTAFISPPPETNYRIEWYVNGALQTNFTGSNMSFVTDTTTPMLMNVQVKITDIHDCSATHNITVEIKPKPATPSISISGDQCIHKPPVCVASNNNLFWSNSSYGTSACFYNSGFVSAFYLDPITGCRSDNATQHICPAPNFDALLTGCYDFCDTTEFPDTLFVYRFMPTGCSPCFRWYHDGNIVGSEACFHSYNRYNEVVPLPIIGFGNYSMTVDYAYGLFDNTICSINSPVLTISQKPQEECGDTVPIPPPPPPPPCDSITIENCYVVCCQVYFDRIIRVCNRTNQTIVYTQLTGYGGYTVTSWWSNPLVLQPGQCTNIFVTIRIDNFNTQTGGYLILYGNSNANTACQDPPCNLRFPINADCTTNVLDCEFQNSNIVFDYNQSSPQGNYYFNFDLLLPYNTLQLISFWTDPQNFLINYNFNPPNHINGAFMITYDQLWQMICDNKTICIYALVCLQDDKFCKVSACVSARDLYNGLPDNYKYNNGNNKQLNFRF
jgi:PKD repeat protein